MDGQILRRRSIANRLVLHTAGQLDVEGDQRLVAISLRQLVIAGTGR